MTVDQLSDPSLLSLPNITAQPLAAPESDIRFTANDIRSILGVPLRHLKLITIVPLVAIALAYGLVKIIPPQYRSAIEILIIDPRQAANDPTSEKQHFSPFDVDQAAISSQIAVITSQSVTLRAAKNMGLDKDPEFLHSPFASFLENIGLSGLFGSVPAPEATSREVSTELETAAYELREHHLRVERKESSYVLEISATARHPAMAQRLANGVGQAYIDAEIEDRYEATQRASRWLKERLEGMRVHLLDTETEIEKLKAQSGLSDIGSGGNINLQQITDINTQLSQAHADAGEKQARYNQAREIIDSHGDIQGISEVVSSQLIGQLRGQRADLSRREAELRTRFGERHPDVVTARSQIYDINNAINAEIARILENMKNTLAVALQREQALRANLDKLTGQRGDSTAVVKLAELKRVADADRKVYESYLGMFNDVQQRATIDHIGVRIITPAGLPTSPSFPRKTLMLVLAGALSLAVAVAIAFLLEFLDAGFRTGAQIERTLGRLPLGMIPKLDKSRLRWGAKGRSVLEKIAASPFSQLSESLRALRTALLLSSIGLPHKIVLVTSSIPGEGKSTLALMLATSNAASKKRTLFIDCDLRRGSATSLLGLGKQLGLAEYLDGRIENSEDIIVQEKYPNLAIVPCGAESGNPTDLISSDRMREFLAHVRDQYDLIILDGAPVLPVVDSILLSKFVEKILFIVEWRKTPRRCVFEAVKVLPLQSRRIASIVLNKVNFKLLQSYGYGYGQGYNYGSYYRSMSKYYGKS